MDRLCIGPRHRVCSIVPHDFLIEFDEVFDLGLSLAIGQERATFHWYTPYAIFVIACRRASRASGVCCRSSSAATAAHCAGSPRGTPGLNSPLTATNLPHSQTQ